LTKQLNEAVDKVGFCIQTAGASTVGYIPFLLGGGSTWMTGMYGLAVDNLISARIVTATKGLVVASETENADLFWALRGAGQFFGIVTEVTTKMFPLDHKITTWTTIFLPSQIKEVAAALEVLANGPEAVRSPGMAAILAPPGHTAVGFQCFSNHKTT
jgi:FAD/FMN-containing dehydrogenase